MILNIALLFLLFGAEKKKISPYVAALLLGLIKGAIYAVFARSLLVALAMAAFYAGLAAAFVYFLRRLDAKDDQERPAVPAYGSPGAEKMKFRWEYLPLVVLLLLIVGGEVLLA